MFALSCSLVVGTTIGVADGEWANWKQQYGKVFNGNAEDSYRRTVYEENLVMAAEVQKLNPEARFGPTKFSDMTPTEFKNTMLTYTPGNRTLSHADLSHLSVTVGDKDWTGSATTPVKDQGNCGSCWAFSATEQIESDLMLQHNQQTVLGPQQLVDCRKGGKSFRFGCTGGEPPAAYEVIESMGGMNSEADYPYQGMMSLSKCKFKKDKVAAKVTSHEFVGKGDESVMKDYVLSSGPLSVCVDASAWHSYQSGVLTDCGMNTDHCVQIVGYGESDGTSYWKVRNSWNTNFGEAGHLRIQYGGNLCDINSEPTRVNVELPAVVV